MKLNKKAVLLKGEYGYFVKNDENKIKIYAGIYNKDKTKVYLLSENNITYAQYLTDIYSAIKLKQDIKGINLDYLLFTGWKFNKRYYIEKVSFDNKYEIYIYSNLEGYSKYPSFSCSVKMLLENEKNINKRLEKVVKAYSINNKSNKEKIFEEEK